MTEYQRQWHIANRPRKLEYMRKYRQDNKKSVATSVRKWHKENPDKAAASKKAWTAKNVEKVRSYKKEWAQDNKDHLRKYARDYQRQRSETDANFKLRGTLRCRLYAAIKKAGAKRAARTLELVGCDIQFLRGHLEARFLPGMTWANHGKWHIDHHIPCAEFDLRDPAQQRQCFHYSNLKPMWGADNMSKGAKRPATHQAELI